jgi:hypothetical protein
VAWISGFRWSTNASKHSRAVLRRIPDLTSVT